MPSLKRFSSCSTSKRSGLGWGQRPESPQSPTTTYQSHSDKEDQGLAGSPPEYGKPGGLLGWESRGEGGGTHYLFIYLCTRYLFIFHGRELEMKSNNKDRERMADACEKLYTSITGQLQLFLSFCKPYVQISSKPQGLAQSVNIRFEFIKEVQGRLIFVSYI